MWFYFTNNFKRFETSPKHKLLSPYQSSYVKWLVHIVELTCFKIASIKLTVVNIYGIFGCQWQSKKALHNSENFIHGWLFNPMASEVKEANISTGLVNLLNHFIFESLVNLRITAIWYNQEYKN